VGFSRLRAENCNVTLCVTQWLYAGLSIGGLGKGWVCLMFDTRFWIAATERAVKTFAQALVAVFVAGVTVLTVDWTQAIAVAVTAAAVSLLTSVASAPFGNPGPSLVDESTQ
jgi:hypothetical protein